jgi:transposase
MSMPRAYSTDLRERVLAAWERREGTQADIARWFSVCEATVENWLRQARQEGRRGPKPHAGGPRPRLTADALTVLHALVLEENAATLAEYADRLAARTGVRVSPPVLCRALQRLGLPRKKRHSARASRTAPRLPPSARLGSSTLKRSGRSGSSSSTRAASRRR